MPQLIAFLLIAVLVVGIIYGIIMIIVFAIIFISINGIVLMDRLLGAWAIFNPIVSWALVGFVIGSVVYSAAMESRKLNRPNVGPVLLTACALFILLGAAAGPQTGRYSESLNNMMTRAAPARASSHALTHYYPEKSTSSMNDQYVCTVPRGVSLRSGPSTKHPVIGIINQGETCELLSNTPGSGKYLKVKTRQGAVGYAWSGKQNSFLTRKN